MTAPFVYHPLGLLIQEHVKYRPDRCSIWFVPADITKTELELVTRDKLQYTGLTMQVDIHLGRQLPGYMLDILRARSERYDEMDRVKCTLTSFITLDGIDRKKGIEWSNIQYNTKQQVAYLLTVLPTDIVQSLIVPLIGEHLTKHMHEIVPITIDNANAKDAEWVCVCDGDTTMRIYNSDGFKLRTSTKTAQIMFRNKHAIFYKSAVIQCNNVNTYNFRGDDHEF